MKLITHLLLFMCFFHVFDATIAQTAGGEWVFNSEGINCVTAEQYELYHAAVQTNKINLTAQGLRSPQNFSNEQVSFIWPVQQANGFNYNSTWAISVYFDHDTTTGGLLDWNCGDRTYDTSSGYNHQGTDIFLWPFMWKQIEEEQTEVIAAAGGQIIFKSDGNFDMNCSFNNDQWNAVFVEHSDGSIAWYGHMKDGSLTSKNVGESVEQGEFLGVIASSGNSTGPHLHFEVYDENNNLIDPYTGACNTLNDSTWWAQQKGYLNSGVNTALTHTNLPDFGDCPDIEVTFESTEFDPGDTIWFIGYFKDQVPGTFATNEIYDPNGNLFSSWNTDFANAFAASWWAQQRTINEQTGEWTYVVSYNGESETHTFNVGVLSTDDNSLGSLSLFPNPTNTIATVEAQEPLKKITISDATGRTVMEYNDLNALGVEMDLSKLGPGIYFVTAKAANTNKQKTLRIVKK